MTRDFWITRLVFQRCLGAAYLLAFAAAVNQFRPLLGERGLLPVPQFVDAVPFARAPSLFYLAPTDAAFAAGAWAGVVLSILALTGLADSGSRAFSVLVWGGLWVLYLSFVNVGQDFYAFGWEAILLEAGFYAMFLGPRTTAVPKAVIWILRWLLFRVMFGAGLIKLRGDPCWRDLTCLDYHYETQPMPNPLSWWFHWGPVWTHRLGVIINHFAELVAPFGYFIAGPVCAAAGAVTIVFQGLIMASGNLSWLNFLTMILAIPCFDDGALSALLPVRVPAAAPLGGGAAIAVWLLTALVALMSVQPAANMLSAGQIMNTSYNPLHLVGTYGAFGSVTRVRREIVLEGSESAPGPSARWKEYEFKGKPGDPMQRPPQIAPYHLRLDWLMWFAAMRPAYDPYADPWFGRLIAKLLQGDRPTLGLLGADPFPAKPPRFIRGRLYEYHFSTPEERRATGRWWDRRLVGEYFPPVSLP
ncbi:MAG TPA: lipase maturation factor family protein [Elusimicrobiota bacterium]|nr:lipase maturation factor family protein [Elusimicrobiota bacterium]